MKKSSNPIVGRINCLPAPLESVPYNLIKTVDFLNLISILYVYEATTQLPLLVACVYMIWGAWRANSETGRMVSFFVLIPPASSQSKEVIVNALRYMSAHFHMLEKGGAAM